ncbi:hypothetical protein ATK17_0938 [Branchiibius hedensis]|uniref:Uncharacterized protein n=1 Tax=Branchiibius hedensis TaxID=672460 RepID=A0A2Y9C142_9MICO|nr:hypothetical protein [Branchiibius hedensis]PWJ24837.1 hypothetical protein ATK17_0938 [Branchiibius hedensis]SSA33653.1 hypothetical protein SAMN04489750_0938 [Branchiibius hedensis]
MSPEPRDDEQAELAAQADYDLKFAQIVAAMNADHDVATDDDIVGPATPALQLPTGWRVPDSGSHSLLDDQFEPPDLDDLPEEDMQLWAIVGALVGAPLWIAYLLFFDPYAGWLWWTLACLLFGAGLVMLVMRQPWSRDPDDHDDGAVL